MASSKAVLLMLLLVRLPSPWASSSRSCSDSPPPSAEGPSCPRDLIEDQVLRGLRERIHASGSWRPFVTLTWAQSIDGSIAAADGSPVQLSGPESLLMTHGLRATHDAILIGRGTALADNPRLTDRFWQSSPARHQPRAVILDPTLASLADGSGIVNRLTNPLIFASATACRDCTSVGEEVEIVPCAIDEAGRCSLRDCLEILRQKGCRSLMVEGGAQIISSFLQHGMVDHILVTLSPIFIGGKTIPFLEVQSDLTKARSWIQLGHDAILSLSTSRHDGGDNNDGESKEPASFSSAGLSPG